MLRERSPMPRRGFLSGLAALPLIGGSVSLIGQPTAAAMPVTDELHTRYLTWLAHEHLAAVREHAYRGSLASALKHGIEPARAQARAYEDAAHADYVFWTPDAPDVQAAVTSTRPSSRAAVILSAAGVPLA